MPETTVGLPVLKDARYQDVARRVIQGQDTSQIARAFGLQTRQVRRILADPQFALVYEEVRNSIYGGADGADKLIRDEKAAISLRKSAAAVRGWTVLGEIMESVRSHIDDAAEATGSSGNAKSATLRAGLDAAVAVIDRADRGMESREGTKHLHLHLPSTKGSVIQETMAESEVDISDIIGVGPIIDAEEVEVSDDEVPSKEVQRDGAGPGAHLVEEASVFVPELSDDVGEVSGDPGDSANEGKDV